ncbi:hypothetical protein D9758_004473 [Tetrapyrgos nigripes]|uniref:Uncharacterized protein n=1 Tax=Tetrapyrgos nigripes TaxID=182062 RepID=A0A8H5GMY6_9AGAR|nr:hypothetical protein D9758_004473 [Tetrapyrgos nigripes]
MWSKLHLTKSKSRSGSMSATASVNESESASRSRSNSAHATSGKGTGRTEGQDVNGAHATGGRGGREEPQRKEKERGGRQEREVQLPMELIGEIALFMEDPYDKLCLGLASRSVYTEILPLLYCSVEFKGSRTCLERLKYLMARPHISNFVKELVLRPNFDLFFGTNGSNGKKVFERDRPTSSITNIGGKKDLKIRLELEQKEKEIASVLEDLAWKGSLEKLEKFYWGGMEVPADSLWKVLRSRCPRLNDIGTNIGRLPLDPRSELFKFDNLTGFSITTEMRPTANPTDRNTPTLPTEMWDMLIKRSPRLENIKLGGHCPMQFSPCSLDISPITSGFWPHLRSVTLEIGGPYIDSAFSIQPYDFYSKFRIFLQSHPTLTSLITHGFPEFICPDFLLFLTNVSSEMPKYTPRIRVHPTLRELDLTGRPNVGVVAQEIGATLKSLPMLRVFKVWMDFSHDAAHLKVYDAIWEYREMVLNAVALEELSVVCSTKGKSSFSFGKEWDEFSQVMHPLYQLKRLQLCKLYSVSDPSLVEAASQYIAENPTLEYISISSMLREEGPYGWPLMKVYKKGSRPSLFRNYVPGASSSRVNLSSSPEHIPSRPRTRQGSSDTEMTDDSDESQSQSDHDGAEVDSSSVKDAHVDSPTSHTPNPHYTRNVNWDIGYRPTRLPSTGVNLPPSQTLQSSSQTDILPSLGPSLPRGRTSAQRHRPTRSQSAPPSALVLKSSVSEGSRTPVPNTPFSAGMDTSYAPSAMSSPTGSISSSPWLQGFGQIGQTTKTKGGGLLRPPPPLHRPTTFWRHTPRSGVTSSSFSPSTHVVRRSTFVAAGIPFEKPVCDMSALGVECRVRHAIKEEGGSKEVSTIFWEMVMER